MRYLSIILVVIPFLLQCTTARIVPFILDELPEPARASASGTPSRALATTRSVHAIHPHRTQSAKRTRYISQEPDLTDHAAGIYPLSSSESHSRSLPFSLQNGSDPLTDYAKQARQAKSASDSLQDDGLLQWTLTNANGTIHVPALFPSCAHLDLIRQGVIEDPNVGLNEGAYRWIIDEPVWTWTADLSPILQHRSFKTHSRFLLYFQGLDTITDIFIGEHMISRTENQFRSWVFDVTSALKNLSGSHRNITLSFRNAVEFASTEAKKEPFYPDQVTFPQAPATSIYEYANRQFIRKQQSDAGWDWGPAYMPTGPHKPAYLVGLGSTQRFTGSKKPENGAGSSKSEDLFVYETGIDIYRLGQKNNLPPDQEAPWIVNVSLSIWSNQAFEKPKISLSFDKTPHGVHNLTLSEPLRSGDNPVVWASFEVPGSGALAPELWWPAAMGHPRQYDLQIYLEPSATSTPVQWKKRTGFRTVVVNQMKLTKQEVATGAIPGTKFQFEVNGREIYVQGSNIIPFDTFYSRISSDVVRWNIESALAVGQNLLRVWGGASYQSTLFYELASELGILTWSETIMACSLYPTYESFISNVRDEVQQNVRRISRFPSNALWAGNNEGEGTMLTVQSSLHNGTTYRKAYDYLFNEIIRGEVLSNTRSISYIPSSTTHGYLSLDPYIPRYFAGDYTSLYGEAEHYDYVPQQAYDVTSYPISRFVNEFGMHSMPSIFAYDRVLTSSQQFSFNSTEVANHNKHSPAAGLTYPWSAADGQAQMSDAVKLWYPTPRQDFGRATLALWSYVTQVHSAAMVSNQISYYRLGAVRGERSRGAVIWQSSDVWEGATWSSIEYGGRWKVLNYAAAATQDHVIGYPLWFADNQTLELHVISDYHDEVQGEVAWTWYTFAGEALKTVTKDFTMHGINSTLLHRSAGWAELIPGHGEAQARDVWLHLTVRGRSGNRMSFWNERFFSPSSLASALLKDPGLAIAHVGDDGADGELFEVSAEKVEMGVAAWVWVEHPEGVLGWFEGRDEGVKAGSTVHWRPSNGFWLKPGETRMLRFKARYLRKGFQDWTEHVTVKSMWDVDN